MVFIGDGDNRAEIESYAGQCGISGKCIFTGSIRDQEKLRAWYSRADLFLFPSTYDTNGLVVREAAACSLASVLIKGSCASEGVTDNKNGFLIEENAATLANCLSTMTKKMLAARIAASKELYISWETAVKTAMHATKSLSTDIRAADILNTGSPWKGVMKINCELMEALAKLTSLRHAR